jgi:hypothetical protein
MFLKTVSNGIGPSIRRTILIINTKCNKTLLIFIITFDYNIFKITKVEPKINKTLFSTTKQHLNNNDAHKSSQLSSRLRSLFYSEEKRKYKKFRITLIVSLLSAGAFLKAYQYNTVHKIDESVSVLLLVHNHFFILLFSFKSNKC